jgi:GntR family transcriptional regulator
LPSTRRNARCSVFSAWRGRRRPGLPTSTGETLKRRAARPQDSAKLALEPGAEVYELNRVRLIDGEPAVLEKIVLPAELFGGFERFERHDTLPNALYALYQREYGLNIVSAQEELRGYRAEGRCRRLKLEPGAPLLHIDRVAISLEGTRVEWRASRCDTSRFVYAVTLS